MPDPEFTFLGDALWLDFVNTAPAAARPDRLADAAAWRRWQKAQKLGAESPHVTLADVLDFRRQLDELADALTARRAPGAAAVAQVNRWLAGGRARPQLVRVAGAWRLAYTPDTAPAALTAIAESAAATLTDPLATVRRCADDACCSFFATHEIPPRRFFCRPADCGAGQFVERRRSAM